MFSRSPWCIDEFPQDTEGGRAICRRNGRAWERSRSAPLILSPWIPTVCLFRCQKRFKCRVAQTGNRLCGQGSMVLPYTRPVYAFVEISKPASVKYCPATPRNTHSRSRRLGPSLLRTHLSGRYRARGRAGNCSRSGCYLSKSWQVPLGRAKEVVVPGLCSVACHSGKSGNLGGLVG